MRNLILTAIKRAWWLIGMMLVLGALGYPYLKTGSVSHFPHAPTDRITIRELVFKVD